VLWLAQANVSQTTAQNYCVLWPYRLITQAHCLATSTSCGWSFTELESLLKMSRRLSNSVKLFYCSGFSTPTHN